MTRKEERIQRAIQYANEAQVNSFNCGQGSLAGLLKEFKEDIGITDIEIDALLKANSRTWGLGGHGGRDLLILLSQPRTMIYRTDIR